MTLKRRIHPLCFERAADRSWRPPIAPIITIPDDEDIPSPDYSVTKVNEPGKTRKY